jgi:hypothetical protein
MSCTNATEVIKTGRVAEVSPMNIIGLAIIFLGPWRMTYPTQINITH